MSKGDPKTMTLSIRFDMRKYAKVAYRLMKNGVILQNKGQVIKEIFYGFADSFENDIEEQKLSTDTFYAKEFLMKQGLYTARGQDTSVHNAQSHQYLQEEFQAMSITNVSAEDQMKIDERAREIEEELKQAAIMDKERKHRKQAPSKNDVAVYTCVNCRKEYDPGTFDNETLSLWKQTQGQICKDCMDKYSNNE